METVFFPPSANAENRKENTAEQLLSIIIPIYNAEKYLNMCVDSILQQTYRHFELLLVDDGSRDSSPQICDGYERRDPRVRAIHKPNGGCSSARNLGIELSRGELLTFVDSDDYLDPDMYQILLQNLEMTGSDVSACSYRKEKESRTPHITCKPGREAQVRILTDRDIFESIAREENSIEGMVWNKVWRREVIGSHRYRTDVAINDDAVFTWETLRDARQVCYCGLPMYHYVILRTGIVGSSKIENYLKGLHGYEIMMADRDRITETCFANLYRQYIVWNTVIFEQLLGRGTPDPDLSQKIRSNISAGEKYWRLVPLPYRIIAIAIVKNDTLAKCLTRLKMGLKRLRNLLFV